MNGQQEMWRVDSCPKCGNTGDLGALEVLGDPGDATTVGGARVYPDGPTVGAREPGSFMCTNPQCPMANLVQVAVLTYR